MPLTEDEKKHRNFNLLASFLGGSAALTLLFEFFYGISMTSLFWWIAQPFRVILLLLLMIYELNIIFQALLSLCDQQPEILGKFMKTASRYITTRQLRAAVYIGLGIILIVLLSFTTSGAPLPGSILSILCGVVHMSIVKNYRLHFNYKSCFQSLTSLVEFRFVNNFFYPDLET